MLTLRNADSATCGSSTFAWSVVASPVVAGFTSTTPAAVSVAPGASQTVTATISALSTVPTGTRVTFTYRATRSASPTTASAAVAALK